MNSLNDELARYITEKNQWYSALLDLLISRNKIPGYRALRINAYNMAVSTTEATVWPKGTVYVFPVAASTMTLYSTDTGDTTQSVLIQGLDSNKAEIQEVVVLNGQTGVTTVQAYLRINLIRVVAGNPVGILSLGTGGATAGIPVNTYGYVAAGDGTSLSTVYTIPAGYTLYATRNNSISGGAATTHAMTVSFKAVTATGVSLLLNRIVHSNDSVVMDIQPPVAIPEKTDIFVNSVSSAGSAAQCVTFSAYLIANTAV